MVAPVYVKGGVWSNLEDQILKAAVSKYGTHQWNKIASLLHKKSSRQCEVRWNEYLKPSLNFDQFSKDEDLKLLSLVRRLPNQWRTISTLMNRPAQICIERYYKLMLNNRGSVNDTKHKQEANTPPTTMKIGEINPQAETQVAIPDKEVLDDDEREMLAEAQARLLATQGKKAQRKVRERMLEESKRIAFLQKRRELKQSGISTKIKHGRKKYLTEINYNLEIPYEQEPLPGVYDTLKETERSIKELAKFENTIARKGLRDKEAKSDSEEVTKKRRRKDNKEREENNTEQNIATIHPEIVLRKKLILSKPGTKDVASNSALLSDKRSEVINNKQIGSILGHNNESDNIPDETPAFSMLKEDEPTNATIPYDTEFDKFMRKRQLIQLFTMLPPPKNDYEIIVSEEENDDTTVEDDVGEEEEEEDVEEDEKENTKEYVNEDESHNSEEYLNDKIVVPLTSMIHENLPIASFKIDPQNDYDTMYNEILLKSMKQEDYEINAEDYLNYMKVEEEIKRLIAKDNGKKITSYLKEIKDTLNDEKLTDVTKLQEDIKDKREKIKVLQSNLTYIEPLTKQNIDLSKQLCGNKLPYLQRLQQEYFVKYKIYRNRSKRINQKINK